MTWLSVALAAGAVVVTVRWWMRRVDALGRPRSFPYFSVALLAVLAVAAAVPSYLRHREEDTLSSVASRLVGTHVLVHCQTFGQEFFDAGAELGYVRWGTDGVPEHQTLIKRGPCKALRAYERSDKKRPSEAQVVAVHVLTHEAMHMRGLTVESAAECAAVQRDAETARLLGADPEQARALARRYWLTVYPRMADDYRSGGCAAGGALDERLADAPWTISAPPSP